VGRKEDHEGMRGGDLTGIGHQDDTSSPETASILAIEKRPTPDFEFHTSV